ncbi:MAG: Unknown protein [uncultured Sulfurovum sp.]|uniref:peptidoglycan glycosyltransferase n=1 Tax=uncultured Sulfurovum sp. TaxID=269237 RepID=A0A6S6SLT2_9BACT|nr:MAG: Unknown protein [uncultured Sulfurovum sp.]
MYSSHIKSVLEEKMWLFQLKYFPFYAEWMLMVLPFIWLITLPYWLPKFIVYLLEGKHLVIKMLILMTISLLTIFLIYMYVILGKPNQEKWKNVIFDQHIKRIAIKIYDATDNMIGGLVNRDVEVNRGIFYVERVPPLYWDVLKFREDKYLEFTNGSTGLVGLLSSPRAFNGIDVIGIPSAILHRRGGGSSLSQQLVKNFYGQDYFRNQTSLNKLNTLLRKYKELDEAKTFYHNLRENDGEEFKRWVAMYSPSLVSAGSVYGIESVAAMVFGKKPKDLSEFEQILLTNMYKYTHYFNGKAHENKCQKIKNGSKIDIKTYFAENPTKVEALIQDIDNWDCTDKPRVPLAFYKSMLAEDTKGQLLIGNPNSRIWDWAGTSMSILRHETEKYKIVYPNHLITEVKITIDTPKNISFKDSVNKAFQNVETKLASRLHVNLDDDAKSEKKQANIWISVVDEKGAIKYIYKRGNTHDKRRIGSISKIFEAIALGNRGDKYDYFYCNEAFQNLHNADGSMGGECQDNSQNNIYSARKVFGASKNLPMMSAFDKYVVKDNKGIHLIKNKIDDEKLQEIYESFNLSRDNNVTLKYELSFGLTNSTPYGLQKSVHKLTHLLYEKQLNYHEAHIMESLKYKIVKESKLINGGEKNSLFLKEIDSKTRKMFDKNTKIYMQTVLKSALDSKFNGTLKGFKSIDGYEPLFMKSGTTDKVVNEKKLTQSKWVAGAIKVKGKRYSLVIMVHSENGIGKKIGHHEIMKPIFKEIVEALNR